MPVKQGSMPVGDNAIIGQLNVNEVVCNLQCHEIKYTSYLHSRRRFSTLNMKNGFDRGDT